MISIYVLRDANGTPRYVGQTKNPSERMGQHWGRRSYVNDSSELPLKRWLASLTEIPTMDVVEVVTHDIRHAVEREWTISLRENGHDLLNIAAGASGVGCGRVLSSETRQRISASTREAMKDPEIREKVIEANRRDRVVSPETRKKLGDALRGKPKSEETKARMREGARRRVERQRAERENDER